MKLKIALLITLTTLPAFALLPATSVFETRGGVGADTNGCGFDSTKSGTDYSQANTPHVAFNGSTITASSVGGLAITITGYTVATTDVGNFLQITGGTGFTAGMYEINVANVGLNTWTLDRSPSGTGSVMTGNMGGACNTISFPITLFQASNILWVKSTASYVYTSTQALTNTINGLTGPPTQIVGYTTTRGDGGRATMTTATNSVNLVTFGAVNPLQWANFTFSSTAGTPGYGWFASNPQTSSNIMCTNCKFTGFLNAIQGNFNLSWNFQNLMLINSEITASTGDAIVNTGNVFLFGSFVHNNAANGAHETNGTSPAIFTCLDSIFKANGTNGIIGDQATTGVQSMGCDFSGNTAAGIVVPSNSLFYGWNNIFSTNGTFGITISVAGGQPQQLIEEFNAFWNNTSGQISGFTPGISCPASTPACDVTLTGDPFVSSSTNNFALNNTAGAGFAAQGVGFPGVLAIGGTGFLDIGALQHQSSGGGGGTVGSAIIQ